MLWKRAAALFLRAFIDPVYPVDPVILFLSIFPLPKRDIRPRPLRQDGKWMSVWKACPVIWAQRAPCRSQDSPGFHGLG